MILLEDLIGRIWLDDTCKFCKEAIELLENKDIEKKDRIILIPDFNSEGHITHFHIVVEKEGVQE